MNEAVSQMRDYEDVPPSDPAPAEESVWDPGTMQQVKDYAQLTDEIADSRAALNAKLAAGKTALIDAGFNKHALAAAIKYAKTEEDKRENFDLTYLYCRRALGVPVQDDLFAAAVGEHVKVQ